MAAVNVDTSHEQAQTAEKREETKQTALTTGYDKLETLIADVSTIDNKSGDKIRERKDDFYARYSWLKPECEKTDKEKFNEKVSNVVNTFKEGWNKLGECLKSAWEWCKENWELLVAAVVAIAVVVFAILTFGAGAVLIAAVVGAAVGAFSQALGDVIATGMHFLKLASWNGKAAVGKNI